MGEDFGITSGGIAGRQDTHAFLPDAIREEAFSVVAERNGRTWFVPLDVSLGYAEADDHIFATGAAREVTGLGSPNMEEYHADSFDGIRHKVAADAVSGEFFIQPTLSPDDRSGPIWLLSASQIENTDDRCLGVAREAIDRAIIEAIATASRDLIREISALAADDGVPAAGSAITDLADALHARDLNRSDRTDGYVVLGAERLLRERRQDEFEASKLAPMLVSVGERSDTARMQLAEKAGRMLNASGLLRRDALADVPIIIQSVLAMPIDDVRECLSFPSTRTHQGDCTAKGISAQASSLKATTMPVFAKGPDRHDDGVSAPSPAKSGMGR